MYVVSQLPECFVCFYGLRSSTGICFNQFVLRPLHFQRPLQNAAAFFRFNLNKEKNLLLLTQYHRIKQFCKLIK